MASSDTPKTIYLRGTEPTYGEANATAAILPGALLNVAGRVRTVAAAPSAAPATTATGRAATFALENQTIGKGIDDPYVIGENVPYVSAQKGDQIFTWLAPGENAALGALLGAGPGGALMVAAAGSGAATPVTFPQPVLAKAQQAVNNAAGASAVRIIVEVI